LETGGQSFAKKRDSRWGLWNPSVEDFDKIIGEIVFHPKVSEEVIRRFELIKKLICYSYEEYDFLDAAYERAFLTFEMAIAQRYYELVGEMPKHPNDPEKDMPLALLIKWATENYLFEDDEMVIRSMKDIRNSVAHPKQYALTGFLGIDPIFRIIEIINGLYDNVELRKERRRIEAEINQKLRIFNDLGGILIIDKKRFLIFLAELLLYDNKSLPHKYHLLFYPIFNIEEDENGDIDTGRPIVVSSVNANESLGGMLFDDKNRGQVEVTMIADPTDKAKVLEWKKRLSSPEKGLNKVHCLF
jgi:hypothetical protein